jgi:hypothetical protein
LLDFFEAAILADGRLVVAYADDAPRAPPGAPSGPPSAFIELRFVAQRDGARLR